MSIWIVPTFEVQDDEIDTMCEDLDLYGHGTADCLDLLDEIATGAGEVPFSHFVDATLIMVDEAGDIDEDYQAGDFVKANKVLASVEVALKEIAELPDAAFPDPECKQDLLDSWEALLPLLNAAVAKNLKVVFQLG